MLIQLYEHICLLKMFLSIYVYDNVYFEIISIKLKNNKKYISILQKYFFQLVQL